MEKNAFYLGTQDDEDNIERLDISAKDLIDLEKSSTNSDLDEELIVEEDGNNNNNNLAAGAAAAAAAALGKNKQLKCRNAQNGQALNNNLPSPTATKQNK